MERILQKIYAPCECSFELMHAVMCSYEHQSVFLKAVEDHKDQVNRIIPTLGMSPLFVAVYQPDPRVVKALLDAGADPNFQYFGPGPNTPIAALCEEHTCISDDVAECLRLLIAAGGNVNSQDSEGFTPLHYAVMYNKEKLAVLLLAARANPDIKAWNDMSPRNYAHPNECSSEFITQLVYLF